MSVVPLTAEGFTQVNAMLDEIGIFGALNAEHIKQILPHLKQVQYPANHTLFEQGSKPDNIYVILDGQVDIFCTPANDTTITIANVEKGSCFGHIAVLGIQPHMGTAITQKASNLLVLSCKALHNIHKESPELFGLLILNIAREACRRLKRSNERLLEKSTV